MRLSIVTDDNTVYLDNVPMSSLDLSCVPNGVHALQWYDNYGVIEYAAVIMDGINSKPDNTQITELPNWAETAIEQWNNAKAAKDAEEAHFASVRAALAAARQAN